jgi:HK97 family phage major capsid protein
MNLTEMRARMTALLGELAPLAQSTERTEDQEARIDAILAEVNDLGPKIERETTIANAAGQRAAYSEPAGSRVSGYVAPNGDQTAEPVDRRSPAQKFIQSEELKNYRRQMAGKSDPVDVKSFYHKRDALSFNADDGPLDQRALIGTGALPTDMILPQQVPGIFRGAEPALTVRDVLINGQTNSDSLVYMRELAFTNAAVEVAQATTVSNGGKPESAITFEQATANVVTIAHWVPITRQTMEDAAQLVTYVENRLIDGLARREDAQLLNGDGTGANMLGLLAQTGIQTLDATYFTANPVNGAGAARENFNRILRAKTRLSLSTVGGATPNFVVINPSVVEAMLTAVDSQNNYYGAGPFVGGGVPNLWGLRVVVSENIAATTGLVGDGSMAAVWDRMQARIYTTDSHSDFFIRNIFVILAEERIALTVFRPAAFAKVTLV